MISTDSISDKHINGLRGKGGIFHKKDPAIIEKMIYALYLLEQLVIVGLEFIFKGGTSLILMLEKPNRFSIDIDIITLERKEIIEEKLNKIIQISDFFSFKPDEKRSFKGNIPKAHYFIYYNNEKTKYILLDILFEEPKYTETVEKEINISWLNTEPPFQNVSIPSVNSILGDKLTAYAPNTTGILYETDKSLEIVKQLFDCSKLIDETTNIKEVYETFISIAEKEIQYRDLNISYKEVLNDIIETALMLSRKERNEKLPDRYKYREFIEGFRSFNNFLINQSFRLDDGVAASAKVAWLATKLKNKDFTSISLFDKETVLPDWESMNGVYGHIQKYKKSNKEAYFYWWNVLTRIIHHI
jgi:predicted nucleotidyltransferase component of viral defense system